MANTKRVLLSVLIKPEEREEFINLARKNETTASQEIRKFIKGKTKDWKKWEQKQ